MDNCVYCEQGKTLDDLMISVCELDYARVYLMRNQNYPGRCVVMCKDHVREIHELSPGRLAGFAAELALVSGALDTLYGADKLNYGIYGDNASHLHCHIVPKKKDGFTWGQPFSLNGNDTFPPQEELKETAARIQKAIAAAHKVREEIS